MPKKSFERKGHGDTLSRTLLSVGLDRQAGDYLRQGQDIVTPAQTRPTSQDVVDLVFVHCCIVDPKMRGFSKKRFGRTTKTKFVNAHTPKLQTPKKRQAPGPGPDPAAAFPPRRRRRVTCVRGAWTVGPDCAEPSVSARAREALGGARCLTWPVRPVRW